MFTAVLFWLFVLCIALQCGYALYFFTRVFNLPVQELQTKEATLPVSVVICARNEAANLERNLPAIMGQNYYNEAGKQSASVSNR